MSSSCLRLVDVRKRFPGGQQVLKGVDLSIGKGEFFSLLGPSGCGKSTLLRIVAGFETADSGRVELEGVDATGLPVQARDVNLVFQNYALFPHMTVEENVAFGLRMQRLPSAEIAKRVRETLELVRMEPFARRVPAKLSGGQQQRVALARALAPHPKLLLLDEPMGALDAGLRQEMQRELRALQRRLGLTFVHVTHDQDEALALSDRIALLREGEVLQVGGPDDLYARPASRSVAEFFPEANFLTAEVDGDAEGAVAVCDSVDARVRPSTTSVALVTRGAKVLVHARPESLAVVPADVGMAGASGAQTRGTGRVVEVCYLGREVRYVVALIAGGRVVVSQDAFGGRGRFEEGASVRVVWAGAGRSESSAGQVLAEAHVLPFDGRGGA